MSLSNADFAQLYASSRRDEYDDIPRKRGGGDSSSHKAKKHKPRPYNPKKQMERDEEKVDSQYRDRAKERRMGISSEFMISEDAVKDLTVEESKYLGGDMEHTHLVKGLDFALLAKMRSEMQTAEEDEEAKREEMEANAQKVEVTTGLGKAMKRFLISESAVKARTKVDIFLPGRTTFVYDLDDTFGSEIPTTISRSLEDSKFARRDTRTMLINKTIMNGISTIMGYIRQGNKPVSRKIKKKEKDSQEDQPVSMLTSQPVAKPIVPDEDIFDDAGEYDLTMRAAEKIN
ncbi:hypothetical protein GUITHDRAFT_153228 [Guillardia theta CCMP2712]|uniref:RED-like N-terminal domain-containing protein n=2 Tax=Guillardia theta TaxID=55529 RepID=L1J543_GUITC|nr:hypothetical protein GUITHDRAFT_153228 [Guillardia theta CCMP2712]EKX43631.1 hypothetical protein GUITHDRAFT_153228 [Guillardia theta CCMP2712]|eukprot:XP_005830611.1 hypothetical protein GUITHDRAFT_153228 [Guillardia theta CCMP2712]